MMVRNRKGRVMGLLVLVLLIILLPVWVAGHWVVGQYPAIDTRKSDPSEQLTPASGSLSKKSSDSAIPPEDIVASNPVASELNDVTDVESNDMEKRLSAERDRLASENEKLLAERNASFERLDRMEADNALLSDQKQQLLSETQSLQEQTRAQSEQLRSARTTLQEMKQRIVAMKQMSVTSPTNVDVIPTPAPKPALQRRWRSTSGKVVPAKFEGLQGDVVLLSTGGTTFRVPLSKLIPEDRAIARELGQ